MFIAMNRFKVIKEERKAFEDLWVTRESHLDEVKGFRAFHLLRGPEREDHVLYSSHTIWASHEDFTAWAKSDQFRAAHQHAGGPCHAEAAPFGVRIKEIAHAIVSAASDKASTSSLSTAAGRRADTNTGPALGARRQGYYSPVCENLRHSRGLGRRAPVSEETRRVQNLRLAPEASETAGGIAGPEPGAGRARVTVLRFFSSVIVRKSTERKNQPEIASPTWRRTRVFVAGSKTTATFWILAIAVPTSVRSGRSDSADQCPDKPTNGPSEPDSAWACAEISKIADAITAFLRQLAEGFKEKSAMNLPFQFPCHGRSRAAVRL